MRTYIGYNYFVKAVMLVYEDPVRLLNTCKEIYIPVAKEFNADPRSVEKDLRTVRDVFMRNNGRKIIQELGCDLWREHPYPRELIEIFAAHLRTNYK